MVTECTVTDYIAVGFDALRSTIGRISMWDFSEYALMVTNCIWPDQSGR